MIDMLKRHEIQVLRRAKHTWPEIAALSGVSEKTARRIAAEDAVTTVDNDAERARRQVGGRLYGWQERRLRIGTDAARPHGHPAGPVRGVAGRVFAARFR
ncbi:MAG: hypothetical protein HY657_17975 [Acidobacteria bacterium]|nr:hypothetical protein [Acidobacteriota bacterium]